MFAKIVRCGVLALGLSSAALLSGCAATDASLASSGATASVTIGQGGSYSIPVPSQPQSAQPYQLAAWRENAAQASDYSGGYQDYGQTRLVIPQAR
jgi:hypothetical protein